MNQRSETAGRALPTHPRRHVLRAGLAGVGALGLAALGKQAIAQNAALPPPRFLFIYTPSGREPSWQTNTPGKNYTLGPTMQMLEPHRDRLMIVDGLTIVNFGYADFNAHLAGTVTMLGGKVPERVGTVNETEGLPGGPQRTFDHLLGDRWGAGTPVRNIVVGGLDRNNDGNGQGISWSAKGEPALAIHEPDKAFAALFAGGAPTPLPTDPAELEARRLRQVWEQQILGLTQRYSASFKSQLGSEELLQLQAYEANLAETFQRVSNPPPDMPTLPPACNTVDYAKFLEGLTTTDYERHHDLQSRILAAGLACGRTRVAAYTMAGIGSSMTVPGTVEQHHFHDDNAVEHYKAFDIYYGHRIKFLLDELASYPEGDGTVLDNTIIVWSSDIGWTPIEHDHDRHPVYLLGGLPNKKLRMGEYVKIPHDPGANRDQGLANHNNRRLHELLLTLAEQMGVTDIQDFADPAYVQGPLTEILV